MDLFLDRREGGTEVVGGVNKWIMKCNWKFAADNFSGDGYHIPVSHISPLKVLASAGQAGQSNVTAKRLGVSVGNGHALNVIYNRDAVPDDISSYLQATVPEKAQRLGATRGEVTYGGANTFPNLSFLTSSFTIRVWHPRGPDKTEVWSWSIIDKAAPPEIKDAMRLYTLRTFSAAGMFEQDDGENWNMCTESAKGWVSRQHELNYQMGLGHETHNEDFPGLIGPQVTETICAVSTAATVSSCAPRVGSK